MKLDKKLLKIFKKNRLYKDSEIREETFEHFAEDSDGNDIELYNDFIIEDVSNSFLTNYIQIVKIELLREIYKEAQKEMIDLLVEMLDSNNRFDHMINGQELLKKYMKNE